jgi:hypothetical protein
MAIPTNNALLKLEIGIIININLHPYVMLGVQNSKYTPQPRRCGLPRVAVPRGIVLRKHVNMSLTPLERFALANTKQPEQSRKTGIV